MSTLADAIRADGGLLAAAATASDVPFSAEEAIREGELVHYGQGRALHTDDPDLALLAGDHLYALGLSDLAARGDLDGIRRFAAIIGRCAQAHAEGRPADAEAAWKL
jgi:hypothetical protein